MQVLTLQIIRAIKLPPNQKRKRTGKKDERVIVLDTHNALGYILPYSIITSVLAG